MSSITTTTGVVNADFADNEAYQGAVAKMAEMRRQIAALEGNDEYREIRKSLQTMVVQFELQLQSVMDEHEKQTAAAAAAAVTVVATTTGEKSGGQKQIASINSSTTSTTAVAAAPNAAAAAAAAPLSASQKRKLRTKRAKERAAALE
jgi:hypothetical protein